MHLACYQFIYSYRLTARLANGVEVSANTGNKICPLWRLGVVATGPTNVFRTPRIGNVLHVTAK